MNSSILMTAAFCLMIGYTLGRVYSWWSWRQTRKIQNELVTLSTRSIIDAAQADRDRTVAEFLAMDELSPRQKPGSDEPTLQ